jgi:hypothetical protein
MFSSPQEYMMLVKTGRDEPLYRAPMAQLNLIQRENDELMKGKNPPVLEFDAHQVHRPEHQALLAEPSVRENPEVMQYVLEHDAAHALFEMGIPPLQGVDEMGQPYPSAVEQLAQAKAEAAAAEQQMMAQQSMTGVPEQGEPTATPPPAQQGPPPQQGPPAMTAAESMQEAAMGPVR